MRYSEANLIGWQKRSGLEYCPGLGKHSLNGHADDWLEHSLQWQESTFDASALHCSCLEHEAEIC